MSAPAVLIATAKLRSGKKENFNEWQARHKSVAHRFPGFISSDLIPPTQPDSNEWTIILNFRSRDDLAVWQRSSERAELIGEVAPLLEGGTFGEVAQLDGPGETPGTNITEVIFTRIKPGMDVTYRDWAVRIQVAQAKYAGYRGMYLQPPAEKDGLWTAIIRFDTSEHFEAWMNSPERAELLRESKVFVAQEQLLRLATSFPGWVPTNPLTGKGPPSWKTAMLVILGVFPMVMLEIRFLSPLLTSLGFRAALTTFIVNCLTAAATTFILMPRFVRWFGWWLFVDPKKPAWVEPAGLLVLVGLYAIEIASVWHLLSW